MATGPPHAAESGIPAGEFQAPKGGEQQTFAHAFRKHF
jgi:hypothetical protein